MKQPTEEEIKNFDGMREKTPSLDADVQAVLDQIDKITDPNLKVEQAITLIGKTPGASFDLVYAYAEAQAQQLPEGTPEEQTEKIRQITNLTRERHNHETTLENLKREEQRAAARKAAREAEANRG